MRMPRRGSRGYLFQFVGTPEQKMGAVRKTFEKSFQREQAARRLFEKSKRPTGRRIASGHMQSVNWANIQNEQRKRAALIRFLMSKGQKHAWTPAAAGSPLTRMMAAG